MKVFAILFFSIFLILLIGYYEVNAQYLQPKDANIKYFYDENEAWNKSTNFKNNFFITLETNQNENYYETEYIRIKSNILYVGYDKIEINVNSLCPKHLYNKLTVKGNDEIFYPTHDFEFTQSKTEENRMCHPAEGQYSFGFLENVERDIYWKHGLEPGNYTLTSSWFDFVSTSIPIQILDNNSSVVRQKNDEKLEPFPKISVIPIKPIKDKFLVREPVMVNYQNPSETIMQFHAIWGGLTVKSVETGKIVKGPMLSGFLEPLVLQPGEQEVMSFQLPKNIVPGNYSISIQYQFEKEVSRHMRPIYETYFFVDCKEGLEFIQKINEHSSCVKPESIPKLIERGWAKSQEPMEFYEGSPALEVQGSNPWK